MQKKLLIILALFGPLVALGVWWLFPALDPVFSAPLFHFYIVTFTTFAATVVSLFVAISVGQTALQRHLLLAVAFAWMGGVFFVHGVTTPNAILTHSHPGIVWGAWLTMFGGAVIFAISGFSPNIPNPHWLRNLTLATVAIYGVFIAFNIFWPAVLTTLLDLEIAPPLAAFVFWLTLVLWVANAACHWLNYRQTQHFIDGLMAGESVWFATATLSLFQFPRWQLSWWLYHILVLMGFLVAIYALWRAYEQVREFRLTRYYAAASLIVTAALALLSAQVYAQLTYNSVVEQLERTTINESEILATDLAQQLGLRNATELRELQPQPAVAAWAVERLTQLEGFHEIYLYDDQGGHVFEVGLGQALVPDATPTPVPDDDYGRTPALFAPAQDVDESAEAGPVVDREAFAQALAGTPVVRLYSPGTPSLNYEPAESGYWLEAFVPFRAPGTTTPIGVFWAVREAPELATVLALTRRAGLAVAAVSLGGLFLALLVIVRRADQLITSRSRELERAYLDLREAEGMRDDLTNMIVHDLRNPLTAVLSNIDLAERMAKDPALSAQFLGSARSASRRMVGLIDDLLHVGKFEAGELRVVKQPVDLAALVTDTAAHYGPAAERDNKKITVQLAPDLPLVPADSALVARVLDNLLSNALKYTEDQGRIELVVAQQAETVLIQVRDNGQGIPPEYGQRIFEKYMQVTNDQGVPLRKGTGLGLAFCRIAIEAQGGKIWVESTPGQGSTFSFTLPLKV